MFSDFRYAISLSNAFNSNVQSIYPEISNTLVKREHLHEILMPQSVVGNFPRPTNMLLAIIFDVKKKLVLSELIHFIVNYFAYISKRKENMDIYGKIMKRKLNI